MSRKYAETCKVCGAKRWYQCDYAFCEKHFLEYMRVHARASYRRKWESRGYIIQKRTPYSERR